MSLKLFMYSIQFLQATVGVFQGDFVLCFISHAKLFYIYMQNPLHFCFRFLDRWIYLTITFFTFIIKQKNSFNWQDANAIKKIFNMKKAEIEHSELAKSSLRIRYCK